MNLISEDYLAHHGIVGQKWGKRNGPPYPLGGGDYSRAEKDKIYKKRKEHNSVYNKKHFDEVLKEGTELKTLSYNKDRTKNADMFYSTHKKLDQYQYNALFNKPVKEVLYDENGNSIGSTKYLKYSITNIANKDIKVASEDSGAKAFKDLYSKDRDFYNFVTDPNRMENYFVDSKYKFKGYRESRDVLSKLADKDYKPTEKDLDTIYRMFNYVLPSDGGGNSKIAKDVATQRGKFFKQLSNNGYSAVLDTNDAIYGGFKAESPVIVFDMRAVIFSGAERTTLASKRSSYLITAGRRTLHM